MRFLVPVLLALVDVVVQLDVVDARRTRTWPFRPFPGSTRYLDDRLTELQQGKDIIEQGWTCQGEPLPSNAWCKRCMCYNEDWLCQLGWCPDAPPMNGGAADPQTEPSEPPAAAEEYDAETEVTEPAVAPETYEDQQ